MSNVKKSKAYQKANSAIHQLASDTTQGSLHLTILAVNIIQQYLEFETQKNINEFKSSIIQLLRKIKSAQPSMAYLITYADDLSQFIMSPLNTSSTALKEKLTTFNETFLDALYDAPHHIATNIDALIPSKAVITTFSNSSTISLILNTLTQQGKKFIVYCSEARPKQEGTLFAKTLCAKGISTVLMTDAELYSSIEQSTVVLIGADAICSQGIINKMGTKPLATIAYHNKIPIYVVCQNQKILSKTTKLPPITDQKAEDIISQTSVNLTIRNHYFDITPFSLLTKIITQSAVYTPKELRSKMKENHTNKNKI